MIEIPSIFENKVLQFPEYSYGVTRTIVELEGGKFVRNVFIAWGKEIVRVGESEDVLFDPTSIISISYQK